MQTADCNSSSSRSAPPPTNYRAGLDLAQVLEVVAEASPQIRAPIVMFTYFNPIMARGLDKFCALAKAAGASGGRTWGAAACACRAESGAGVGQATARAAARGS